MENVDIDKIVKDSNTLEEFTVSLITGVVSMFIRNLVNSIRNDITGKQDKTIPGTRSYQSREGE